LPPFDTKTDASGSFSVRLDPNSYTVEILVPEKAALWVSEDSDGNRTLESDSHEASSQFIDQEITDYDLTVTTTVDQVTLTGIITTDGGAAGLEGAIVSLWAEEQMDSVMDVTDATGAYSVTVDPGQYEIEIKLSGHALVFVGLDVDDAGTETVVVESSADNAHGFYLDGSKWSQINVELATTDLVPLVNLRGMIKMGDDPLSGAALNLYLANEEDPDPFVASTEQDGSYDIELPPALYEIILDVPDSAPLFLGLEESDDDPPVQTVVAQDNPDGQYSFFVGADAADWQQIDVTVAARSEEHV